MNLARFFGIALAFVLVIPGTSIADSGTGPLKLASDVWPPFTDVQGKPRRALDLVEAALSNGKIPSSTTITSWENVLSGLQRKSFDGCGAMWRSKEREEFLLFSEPYLENRLVLIGRAGTGVESMGITGLQGKRLALVPGYAYGNVLRQLKDVTLVYGPSDIANFQKVYVGQADFALAEELLVDETFKHYSPRTQRFMAAGTTPIFRRSLHLAIRKDYPGAEKIISAFNHSMSEVINRKAQKRHSQVFKVVGDTK